jgi:hypothetical protein
LAQLLSEHLFEASVHLFLFDEFAPICISFALKRGGAESRVLLRQP